MVLPESLALLGFIFAECGRAIDHGLNALPLDVSPIMVSVGITYSDGAGAWSMM
jgi:hypothetical protein